jgi:hypothetical protein
MNDFSEYSSFFVLAPGRAKLRDGKTAEFLVETNWPQA